MVPFIRKPVCVTFVAAWLVAVGVADAVTITDAVAFAVGGLLPDPEHTIA